MRLIRQFDALVCLAAGVAVGAHAPSISIDGPLP